MSSTIPLPAATLRRTSSLLHHLALVSLGLGTVLVHGYHPYADDAGLYVAGVEKLLDPSLFSVGSELVLAETHVELFAHVLAGSTRWLHCPLAFTLLAFYLASVLAFVYAAWYVVSLLTASHWARWTAVALACCLFTLPVAGTSINIMEPYLGPRMFALPLGLFAVALTLDRACRGRWAWLTLVLLLSAALHPLVTLYTISFLLVLALLRARGVRAALGACALALLIGAVLSWIGSRLPVDPVYRVALDSRTYAFLADWAWYELLGLALPLCLFAAAALRFSRKTLHGQLIVACLLTGITSLLCSALYVHRGGGALLPKLMMLRAFHLVYAAGVLLLGTGLGVLCAGRGRVAQSAQAAGLAVLAFSMYFVQCAAFGHSNHLELPGIEPRNSYQQAFLWVRDHTPPAAVFATDPRLVFAAGDDQQNFRAMALRGILADTKDEGLVFIFPNLPTVWLDQLKAQNGIAGMSDAQRTASVARFGATWILLPSSAPTHFLCPYRNDSVAVCRLGTAF